MTLQDTVRKENKTPKLATQRYLQFAEVHDDTLVLKNGGLRAVLEVSSINFNLKSEAEQESIIGGFQQFLNALDFPVQILVHSRRLDIDNYIEDLKSRERKVYNERLQGQMSEYIEYISKLVEHADIMEKKFFVVIPTNPARAEKKGAIARFLDYIKPDDTVMDILQRKREFHDQRKTLDTRINVVRTALGNCALQTKLLGTEDLIELFYQSYNPSLSHLQKVPHAHDLAMEGNPSEDIIEEVVN